MVHRVEINEVQCRLVGTNEVAPSRPHRGNTRVVNGNQKANVYFGSRIHLERTAKQLLCLHFSPSIVESIFDQEIVEEPSQRNR
jgi:hypothetical protein